jgi:hypothetical protein
MANQKTTYSQSLGGIPMRGPTKNLPLSIGRKELVRCCRVQLVGTEKCLLRNKTAKVVHISYLTMWYEFRQHGPLAAPRAWYYWLADPHLSFRIAPLAILCIYYLSLCRSCFTSLAALLITKEKTFPLLHRQCANAKENSPPHDPAHINPRRMQHV